MVAKSDKPPKGELKANNNGMLTINYHQLVIWISLAHPQYQVVAMPRGATAKAIVRFSGGSQDEVVVTLGSRWGNAPRSSDR